MAAYYLLVQTDDGEREADECEAPSKREAEGIFRSLHPTAMRLCPWRILDHAAMLAKWQRVA